MGSVQVQKNRNGQEMIKRRNIRNTLMPQLMVRFLERLDRMRLVKQFAALLSHEFARKTNHQSDESRNENVQYVPWRKCKKLPRGRHWMHTTR